MPRFSAVAAGNIAPSRFVIQSTTLQGQVTQATAGAGPLWGISQPGTRNTPYSSLDDGFAAIAGENLTIFGPNMQCLLELGGTVTLNQRLKSDLNGKGIATTADGDEYGALAMMAGAAGDLIEVQVEVGQRGA
jgi:hypothetical protein